MVNEVERRYMNLFYGIGKHAAKVSETVSKVIPDLREEPATVSEIIRKRHDNRCTAHGLHKNVCDGKD